MRISDWSSDVCSSDLLSEQLFQAAPGYVSSGKRPDELTSLLHPRTIDAITKTPDAELRFDYPAYAHQLRTWELLRNADPQSVLVSSGTGSGKTERSEEHTSELQSLMRISYAVFCLKTNKQANQNDIQII